MTGSPFSWDNRMTTSTKPTSGSIESNCVIDSAYARYLGGHPLSINPRDAGVFLYNDRIEIEGIFFPDRLLIPYSTIHNVQNANENEISAFRILMFGLVGAFWKKKHLYTILQYKDDIGEKSLVLEFHDNDVNRMQYVIYDKIVEFQGK